MKRCKSSEKTQNQEKNFKKKHPVIYILGSIVTLGIACITIPSAMTKVTGIIYKILVKFNKKIILEGKQWKWSRTR